jgi:hypothetical protein
VVVGYRSARSSKIDVSPAIATRPRNGTSSTPNGGRQLRRHQRSNERASTQPRLEQILIQSNLSKQFKKMLGIFDDDRLTVCGEQQHKPNHTARRPIDATSQGRRLRGRAGTTRA